ncbi:MAG: response regulator transcription factor [Synergistaceae bacterium]|jgi:two-component system response regulator CpxR|nr:response regulator transcription factor [Synergistaceae bacterium]
MRCFKIDREIKRKLENENLKILEAWKIKSILMIDDDVELCALLGDYFQAEGFGFACAHSGDEGLDMLNEDRYGILILDVMLPGRDGFDILKEIRNTSLIPVIMLTAKGDHLDRVVGLEIGADDYICKPFDTRELSARVRAVLRRSGLSETTSQDILRVADLEMDLRSLSAKVGGQGVFLTNVEFRLLKALLSCAGRKISAEQLSINVLGHTLSPFDRSLSVHMSKLRRKLGPYPGGSERIKTLRGEGFIYVFPEKEA